MAAMGVFRKGLIVLAQLKWKNGGKTRSVRKNRWCVPEVGSAVVLEMVWKTQLCSRRRLTFREAEEHVVVRGRWYVVGYDNADSEVWISWILVTG